MPAVARSSIPEADKGITPQQRPGRAAAYRTRTVRVPASPIPTQYAYVEYFICNDPIDTWLLIYYLRCKILIVCGDRSPAGPESTTLL